MSELTPVSDLDELEAAIAESSDRPVLLFKHSRNCGVSCEALDELRAHVEEAEPAAVYKLITVQSHRRVSDAAAHASASVTRRRRRSCCATDGRCGPRRTSASPSVSSIRWSRADRARRPRARRWNPHSAPATASSPPDPKIRTASIRAARVVQTLDIRQSAAKHDGVGIDDVDDRRQRFRQTPLVTGQRRVGAGVAGRSHAPRSRRLPAFRRFGMCDRATCPVRTRTSRCTRCVRNSTAGLATLPARATASGCGPTRRQSHSRRRARGRPATIAPPVPVPTITPNTIACPAAAPSIASESAKQLASFASRTHGAVVARCPAASGLPFNQVELAFLTRPVAGEIVPGIPIPTGARPTAASASSTSAAIASSVPS